MKYTKTEIYEVETEDVDLFDDLLLITLSQNEKEVDEFFFRKEDFKTLEDTDTIHALFPEILNLRSFGLSASDYHDLLKKASRRYYMRTPLFLEKYKNGQIGQRNRIMAVGLGDKEKYSLSAEELKECNRRYTAQEVLDLSLDDPNLMGYYSANQDLFFPLNLKGKPLTKKFHIGIYQELNEDSLDLDACLTQLQKDARILDVEIKEISRALDPDLSDDFFRYITYQVVLPQKEFETLYKDLSEKGSTRSWQLRDELSFAGITYGSDPLNLAQHLLRKGHDNESVRPRHGS